MIVRVSWLSGTLSVKTALASETLLKCLRCDLANGISDAVMTDHLIRVLGGAVKQQRYKKIVIMHSTQYQSIITKSPKIQ